MTTLCVSLDVVVDDADERLCSRDCPHGGFKTCTLYESGRKPVGHLGGEPNGWLSYARSPDCVKGSALAASDDAVLEAAERWGNDDDGDTPIAEELKNAHVLQAAIDARRKLRGSKSE